MSQDTKICNHCGFEGDISLFRKKENLCKSCHNKKRREYYSKNKEKENQKCKEYYINNKEKIQEVQKQWRKKNPGLWNARSARYRNAKLRATPKWANHAIIKDMYAKAASKGQHVDHIVPLKNGLVCGLHCEDNLQLLDPAENLSKGNSFNV